MSRRFADTLLTGLVATVWLLNGLYAKLLGEVPRHREIVAEILGAEYAGGLTRLIGFGEILIALWVVLGRWPRACALLQLVLVGTMNLLEALLVPELLLWGRWNAVFALCFMVLVYYHGFHSAPRRRGP